MLYDGECSLCMKEVSFLRARDAAAGKIDFVDIADPTYQPDSNAGITFEQVGCGCIDSAHWSRDLQLSQLQGFDTTNQLL